MRLLCLCVFVFAAFAADSGSDPDPQKSSTSPSTLTETSTTILPPTEASTSPVSSTSADITTSASPSSPTSADTTTSASPSSDASTSATDLSSASTSPSATTSTSSETSTSTTILPTTDISTSTSTLPPVDVNYVEFKRECSPNGNCEFTFVAPHNDQAVLAEERKEIENDSKQIEDISEKIEKFTKKVAESTNNAEEKIKNLSKKLEEMKKLLATYQDQLKEIEENAEQAEYQLIFPQQYLDMLALNQQLCYSKCVGEATTSAPTTTTPPPPTTTPSPCVSFECNNGGGDCKTDNYNAPYCTCPGNLDGYQHCDTGACNAAGITIVNEKGKDLPFLSPGFTLPSGVTAQNKSINCIWTLDSPNGYIAGELSFAGLDTKTSKLIFQTPGGAESIATNKLNKKKLNLLLGKPPITVQFMAKEGSESHFYWIMKEKEK